MHAKQHSFGGSSLDRYVFDFDPDDGADAAGAGAGAAADAAGDGGAAAAADASAAGAEPGSDSQDAGDGGQAAAPAPSDDGLDPRQVQAELEFLREQNAQLEQRWQQIQAGAAAGSDAAGDGLELDPFDDNFGTSLLQAIRQELQQAVQPLAGRFEQADIAAVEQEGEERIKDAINDDVARNGEFVPIVGDTPEDRKPYEEADRQARQLVRTIADNLFPQYAARYGVGPRAGEFAIEKASQQVRALLKATGDAAVARETNRLATLAGGHGAAGAGAGGSGGAAVVQSMSEQPLTPEQLARKYGRSA